jgi:hypothetical protein
MTEGATGGASAGTGSGSGQGSTGGMDLPPACENVAAGDPAGIPVPELTAAMLEGPATPGAPVSDGAFRMPDDALPPQHRFEGRLELLGEDQSQIDTLYAVGWLDPAQATSTLPAFDREFVQCGHELIPVERGRVVGEDPFWDLVVGPGKVWSTPHDGGRSRAAFPFALTMKVENCVQNGVMTFLYDDTSVSQVRYQITQETCHFHRFDLWGQSAATYHPAAVAGATQIRSDFADELEGRLELRALSELPAAHPGVDLGALDQGLTLADLSFRALLVGDTLYTDVCRTRFGSYAFCETMLLPSFSVSKTAFVSIATMALVKELGEDIHADLVGDLLPAQVAAAPGDWSAVTLEHLIDMATGHWQVAGQGDDAMGDFYLEFALANRLAASFLFPDQEPPGQRVVYLTPNYQIAAAVLDQELAAHAVVPADGFDYLVDRVLRPIGVPPESFASLRTWEGGGQNNGTAFGGYGMYLTPDGIAKIARFLRDGGEIDAQPVLDPDRLRDTLFRNPADQGPPMYYGAWRYNNGMWGYPVPGAACDAVAAVMFGVSGITVAILPNGVVWFAFDDAQEQPVDPVLQQAAAIAPYCP